MPQKIFLSFLVVLVVFTSCSGREQQEKQADERLSKVRSLINENKLNEAKSEIDSVHLLFPRLVDKRKLAVALKDSIILRESHRTVNYCNKVLPELKAAYEQLEKNFAFQKNEKYEETGKYIYKTQRGEQNAVRNYLKCEVDENSDFFITSMYSGSKINHFAIKAQAAGMEVLTDTVAKNAGVLHTFSDGESNFEQLTFKNDADGGLAAFINSNKQLAIKITLIGSKRMSYVLTQGDKDAIVAAYGFANARKLLRKTENDLRIAQQRIGKINLLYQE